MKKIGFLIYDFSQLGGAERVASNLMNELSGTYSIDMISMFNRYNREAYNLNSNIEVNYIYNRSGHILKSTPYCIKYIRHKISEKKYDYLLCIDVTTAMIGVLSTFMTETKCIICDHSSIFNKDMYAHKNLKLYCWCGIHFSYRYVTLTEASRVGMIDKFHINSDRVVCIPNWIDEKAYKSKKYCEAAKKIITVGRADTVKNYELLIEIAKEIRNYAPDWEWHIWGNFEGEYGQSLLKRIKENKIGDFLIYQGSTNDLYSIYGNYAFYVLTSKFEGLPMVLLEAKANCLPTISFDCKTGPSEIIGNNVDGLLIPDGDKDKMINGIKYLIDNPQKRIEFSLRSHESLKRFMKKEILLKWIEILN